MEVSEVSLCRLRCTKSFRGSRSGKKLFWLRIQCQRWNVASKMLLLLAKVLLSFWYFAFRVHPSTKHKGSPFTFAWKAFNRHNFPRSCSGGYRLMLGMRRGLFLEIGFWFKGNRCLRGTKQMSRVLCGQRTALGYTGRNTGFQNWIYFVLNCLVRS